MALQEQSSIQGHHQHREARGASVIVPTAGSLVRELRLGKGLTQADFALALGWRPNASRISDIEQGLTLLDEQAINQLTKVFNLDELARSELLLASRLLPSDKDISKIVERIEPELRRRTMPSYVKDFGWRMLVWNDATLHTYGLAEREQKLRHERPNILELVFDPTWGVRSRLDTCWEDASRYLVEAFYLEQSRLGSAGQRWYEMLLIGLFRQDGFVDIWNAVSATGRRELLRKRRLGDAGEPCLKIRVSPNEVRTFRVMYSPGAFDARLSVATHIKESDLLEESENQ